ncbi:MAG TPA: hypothetical protein VEG44_07045 [Candidatus Acidoferrales bacterium]|nr:hypothetical protein [Candidatus Acidoferrales bacterium]
MVRGEVMHISPDDDGITSIYVQSPDKQYILYCFTFKNDLIDDLNLKKGDFVEVEDNSSDPLISKVNL